MAALSLKRGGGPVRLQGRFGTHDTHGVVYAERQEGEGVVDLKTTLTIPGDVPAEEQDMAVHGGRDYRVLSGMGGGSVLQRLEVKAAS